VVAFQHLGLERIPRDYVTVGHIAQSVEDRIARYKVAKVRWCSIQGPDPEQTLRGSDVREIRHRLAMFRFTANGGIVSVAEGANMTGIGISFEATRNGLGAKPRR